MGDILDRRLRWLVVVIYAIAMAWVEAAVVYYLRTMVHRIEPHQPNPLPLVGDLGVAELVREAATLIMLLTVGILAGRTWHGRLGYAAIAFGFWDIFYYVFLKVLCGWPHTLVDWDVLFLLPLPWWGPVLAPILISLLMIGWGTLTQFEATQIVTRTERIAWVLSGLGMVLALYLFMADTLRVSSQGVDAVRNVVPVVFHWAWFSLALVLMSAPVWSGAYRLVRQTRASRTHCLALPGLEKQAADPLASGVPGVGTDTRYRAQGRATQSSGL